ncbi:hypothetical protein GCM10027275_01940 [Rhabdobacter roseus]|uniref:Putative membrane channel-forming protein YqfA (Hemolysin III family) n=1 Tax=Rhabdobacter roseus TaxID=1655419 RepID=A0A840TPV2_9BACT|nr:hypothetical protein [Rhabdobacter roseus]MBB5282080.1 putative membrane channel-forming protein YqfA (hemolysin III family) [Rhabdobacter roseus]
MGFEESILLFLLFGLVTLFVFSVIFLLKKPIDTTVKIFWVILMGLLPYLGVIAFWVWHFSEKISVGKPVR